MSLGPPAVPGRASRYQVLVSSELKSVWSEIASALQRGLGVALKGSSRICGVCMKAELRFFSSLYFRVTYTAQDQTKAIGLLSRATSICGTRRALSGDSLYSEGRL